jgi:hypothetical protein
VLPARREEIPRFIEPMLASTRHMPIGEEWAFEVKWDARGCSCDSTAAQSQRAPATAVRV